MPRKGKFRNPAAVVAASGLPTELGQRVLDVTGKCRLWNRERVAVAEELTGHFRDGLEAGALPAELLGGFGESRSSARLITRAMRRKRPLWWKAWVRAWQGAGVLLACFLLFWAVLVVRLYTGTPQVKRNIAWEYNERVLATPETERAWKGVRAMAVAMPTLPEGLMNEDTTWPEVKPGTKQWTLAEAYLAEVKPSLDELRRLTRMSRLGRALTVEGDNAISVASPMSDEVAKMRAQPEPRMLQKSDDVQAVAILLPHLAMMRNLARTTIADARSARQAGDAARVAEDLRVLRRLADWSSEDNLLISQFVGIAIATVHDGFVRELLWQNPGFLSVAQLTDIAHGTAASRVMGGIAGSDQIAIDGERMMMDDVLQRTFTDDGHGDGRVTREFFRIMPAMFQVTGKPEKAGLEEAVLDSPPLQALGTPLIGSRREWHDAYETALGKLSANQRRPLLERWRAPVQNPLDGSGLGSTARTLVGLLVPAIEHAGYTASIYAMDREATLAAIGLELYKRAHGKYPSNLAELTPRYLPTVPLDRFDGLALRYRASTAWSDGRPVLYSIGGDGQDDGAPAYLQPGQEMNARTKAYWTKGFDYILWPPIKGPAAPSNPPPTGG
ncbi:MAG: hypothetical protein ACREJO_19075, partial [Phycisphaerales bacterium]